MMTKFNPDQAGSTDDLRLFLSGFFDKHGIEAYYFDATEDASFPYIVYELRHIGTLDDDDQSRRYIMEIDAYTDKTISQLDNLLDFLESRLNGLTHFDGFFLSANLGYGRIDVEEERDLKRKRILFELNYWPKEYQNGKKYYR